MFNFWPTFFVCCVCRERKRERECVCVCLCVCFTEWSSWKQVSKRSGEIWHFVCAVSILFVNQALITCYPCVLVNAAVSWHRMCLITGVQFHMTAKFMSTSSCWKDLFQSLRVWTHHLCDFRFLIFILSWLGFWGGRRRLQRQSLKWLNHHPPVYNRG